MIRQLLVSLLCATSATAKPVHSRAEAESEFNLFAYGHGLGGHPVVERDGAAYIVASPSSTDCQNVTFRADGKERKLKAHVGDNTMQTLFAVPKTPGPIGFARDAANTSMQTTGFGLYDSFLYLDTPGAGMKMDWFARPVPGAEDTWELGWQFGSANGVPVSLRDTTPSK